MDLTKTALTGGAFWTLNRGETFFFDIFGLDGLKGFIIQDGKKVVEKILFGTEQLIRTGNKITLVNRKFNLNACKNLSKKEFDNLSDTTRDFFYFIQSFGNKLKLRDFLNIWMVEDRIQDLSSVTCSIFQIYFYDNLFNPGKRKPNKKTIETLVNELLVLHDQEQQEATINEYVNDCDITIIRLTSARANSYLFIRYG